MISSRRVGRFVLFAILASCGSDGPTVPEGTVLSIGGGDGQSVQVTSLLASPLMVLVTDAAGAPMAGVAVAWSIGSGGGSLTPSGVTGTNGFASASYTPGTTSGPKVILATVNGAIGSPALFHITVQAGAPKRLLKLSGDLQTTTPNAPLPNPLAVQAVDTFGNGVPGVTVNWLVSGNGAVTAPASITDAIGTATNVYTASAVSGTATVSADAGSLAGSPVTFTATTGAGAAGVSLVAEVAVPANYGEHDQFVRAGLAFFCAWDTGVRIYDVGDGRAGGSITNPVFISQVVTGGGAVHNAWWYWGPGNNRKYVFVGQEGPGGVGSSSSGDIHVVDISNINLPVEVAQYHMTNPNAGTHNFWVDETAEILYAAYYNGGVVALDISGTLSGDLASREIARFLPGGAGNTYVWGVQLYNNSLYATDMLSGFYQLRLVGSAFQKLAGGNNVPERYGSDQWVANGYAYSGTWGNRAGRAGNAVKIWRLDGTGAPVLVDSIITASITTVSDVEVSADNRMLLFSAEGGTGSGIYFYSLVADPARPTFIARYPVVSNGNRGIHTASFYEAGGRRYVFAAKNPNAGGATDPKAPSTIILDVTPINP